MADPVLDKAEVRPRVEEVRGDRVLQHGEVPLRGRDAGRLAIVFHEGVELPAGDRGAPLREKEARGLALPLAEVGLEGGDLVRTQGQMPDSERLTR
jgi:hypothetical protein